MSKKPLTKEEIQKAIPQGHAMPITRRQFLAHGLVEGLGFMAMPAMIDMFLRPSIVMGEECPTRGGAAALVNELPMLVIDGSGGFIRNNMLPLDEGKQPLASYSRLGIPDGSLTMDSRFGIPMRVGPFFTALTTQLSAAGQALSKGAMLAVQSGDDTGNNRWNPAAYVAAANAGPNAAHASYFLNGLGSRNSASGGNSASVLLNPTPPLASNNVTTILNAVNPTFGTLSAGQRQKLLDFSKRLTDSEVAKLRAMTNGQQLATALGCGMGAAQQNGGGAVGLDSRVDTNVQAVFGVTAASNDANARNAQIVYSLLQGQALAGTIEIGGCDNHGQGQATMDTKHAEIGTLVGRAMELAFRMQKNLFVVIISDGGQSSQPGATSGSSDAGDKSAIEMFCIKAKPGATAVQLVNGGMGGFYSSAQSASTATYIGGNPTRAAAAAFGNWLALHEQDRLSQFASVVTGGVFDPTMLSPFIVLT